MLGLNVTRNLLLWLCAYTLLYLLEILLSSNNVYKKFTAASTGHSFWSENERSRKNNKGSYLSSYPCAPASHAQYDNFHLNIECWLMSFCFHTANES